MTILEAISRVDRLEPNGFSQEEKVRWLGQLEGQIFEEILKTHEGGAVQDFRPYDEQTPLDTVLLVGAPFEELYLHDLRAIIHYCNGEYDRFNQAAAMFQKEYKGFVNHYNRTHMPLARPFRYD